MQRVRAQVTPNDSRSIKLSTLRIFLGQDGWTQVRVGSSPSFEIGNLTRRVRRGPPLVALAVTMGLGGTNMHKSLRWKLQCKTMVQRSLYRSTSRQGLVQALQSIPNWVVDRAPENLMVVTVISSQRLIMLWVFRRMGKWVQGQCARAQQACWPNPSWFMRGQKLWLVRSCIPNSRCYPNSGGDSKTCQLGWIQISGALTERLSVQASWAGLDGMKDVAPMQHWAAVVLSRYS